MKVYVIEHDKFKHQFNLSEMDWHDFNAWSNSTIKHADGVVLPRTILDTGQDFLVLYDGVSTKLRIMGFVYAAGVIPDDVTGLRVSNISTGDDFFTCSKSGSLLYAMNSAGWDEISTDVADLVFYSAIDHLYSGTTLSACIYGTGDYTSGYTL